MQNQTKTCQNCKNDFIIEVDDFAFYDKIKVPPPTFCPECRLVQRLVWRNEKSLYKRDCDLCKKSIVSIYSIDKPHTVYCRECFHSDNWDPTSFQLDIDFSRSFLEQFKELQLKVPRIASFVFQNTNSEYVNGAAFNKNCYMIFVSDNNEDLLYSYSTQSSRNSSDLLNCNECEKCYECLTCNKCYKVCFSYDCSNSQNLLFCKNCVNCQDCIGSVNLRNSRYCLFNKQYSKEEYFKKVNELNLNTREGLNEMKKSINDFYIKFPVKYLHGLRNVNVTGDYIFNSKKAKNVFDSDECEDTSFVNHGHKIKDVMDSYVLVDKSERVYNVVSGIALSNSICGYCVWHGYNVYYSDTCENSNNIFGCVGLKKKEYFILNKKYSKQDYEIFVEKIKKHMVDVPFIGKNGVKYIYGDFFPKEISLFAYNETVALEYKIITEQQAKEEGLIWKKEEERNYKPTLYPESIPEKISDIDDSIVNEIIACDHSVENKKCKDQCTTAFKITVDEFNLYKSLDISLPTLCFNCRHASRISNRNLRALHSRTCMCASGNHVHVGNCEVNFETTYAPDRPEIVYCEKCYQQEVN